MNRYELEEKIGEGAFGTVYLAKKKGEPNKYYAVKRLKHSFSSWKEVLVEREFHAMVVLRTTQNKDNHGGVTNRRDNRREWRHNHNHYLVHAHEIIRECDSSLYFVMEHMGDGSLHDYISEKSKRKLSRSREEDFEPKHKYIFDDSEICSILFQAFRGLCHVHSKGLVHRDVKPENILLAGRKVKLADFSLARPISERGDCCAMGGSNCHQKDKDCGCSMNAVTDYVGTRWYRAPELLCPDKIESNIDSKVRNTTSITTAIDVFSMGCVAAELYLCHPLFCGRDEKEQLQLIEELLLFSTPPFPGNRNFWGYNQDVAEQAVKKRLKEAISTTDPRASSFLYHILQICPEQRANVETVLRHEYFEREFHKATIPATRANTFSTFGLLESMNTFSSANKKSIEYSSNQPLPPPASTLTSNGVSSSTIQFQRSPSARITPTAEDLTLAKGDSCEIQNKRNFHKRESPPNVLKDRVIEDNQVVCRPLKRENKGTNVGMGPTPLFERKRQKLRPSRIFNID